MRTTSSLSPTRAGAVLAAAISSIALAIGGSACSARMAPATPAVGDGGNAEDAGVTADVAPADAACGPTPSAAGAHELPAPRGPFGVARGGRRTMVDLSRMPDPSGDPDAGVSGVDGGPPPAECARNLSVEIWYPTDPCPSAEPAPYLDDAEAAAIALNGDPSFHRHVLVRAVRGAPFAKGAAKHPLVLFSPGYGALPRTYAAVLGELASHGYVVAAISHTFWTPITVFADGSSLTASHTTPTPATEASELAVWLADARFVLDELTKANLADPLGEIEGRLDLDRVGMLGHSFGGATAMNLLATDPRVKAAVDLDGAFERPATQTAYAAPFLSFTSDHAAGAVATGVFDAAVGPAYALRLGGAEHGSFLDLGLLLADVGAPDPADFGPIDPKRALDVIDAYDVAFFDKHLAGRAAPLLDGPTAAYPEITTFDVRR